MNEQITQALQKDRLIDITTTGRKSGEPRRVEIWFHNIDGEIYITGMPGKRDWYANLVANPAFTFHLKVTVEADILATATPITERREKRRVLQDILAKLDRTKQINKWVANSPLVRVHLHLDQV